MISNLYKLSRFNLSMVVLSPVLLGFIIIIALWELLWKGLALWNCGRNNQIIWFVFILLLNTAGILPIIYLLLFQKKGKKRK